MNAFTLISENADGPVLHVFFLSADIIFLYLSTVVGDIVLAA